MHHKGFVKGLFVVFAFDVNQRSLGKRGQHFVRRLRFEEHFTRYAFTAHAAFTRVNRVEIGVRHPRGIEVDRRHVQSLFDPVRVVQQTVIGRVGDHRMDRPACAVHCRDLAFNGFMRELPPRNTAKNTERVARGRQPERYNVAHHQQVRQRFMAVTVNQQGAPRRRGIHSDDFVRGRGAVGHHIALLGPKGAGDILFGFQMRSGMIQQRA